MNAPLNASAALWPEHFYLIDAAGTQQHGLAGDASRDSMGSKAWNLLRMAQAAMANRDTSVSELCKELKIRPVTLYRYVDPEGNLRENGKRLLGA